VDNFSDSLATHNFVDLYQLAVRLQALENAKYVEDQQRNHNQISVTLPDLVQENIDSPSPQEGQFKPYYLPYVVSNILEGRYLSQPIATSTSSFR
jgi:hypothetical protein